jgi:trimeric intracellular cation channel
MLLCFSGSILTNFLLGESPIKDFYHHQHLLLATLCWYFVFYSPLDLIARLLRFIPIRLLVGIGKEIRRTRKIYEGVHSTLTLYPDGYIIVVFIGAIKGKHRNRTWSNVLLIVLRLWWSNSFVDRSFHSRRLVTNAA